MLAAEARDLDELSGGRFILGIGNGTRRMISDWHGADGDAPGHADGGARAADPADSGVSHEGPIDHQGRFYRLKISSMGDLAAQERRIPIYTAGVNPRMIESAGRVADGLLGHTLFGPRYIERGRPPGAGARRRACRPRSRRRRARHVRARRSPTPTRSGPAATRRR